MCDPDVSALYTRQFIVQAPLSASGGVSEHMARCGVKARVLAAYLNITEQGAVQARGIVLV
jgi:hypothetical protein